MKTKIKLLCSMATDSESYPFGSEILWDSAEAARMVESGAAVYLEQPPLETMKQDAPRENAQALQMKGKRK